MLIRDSIQITFKLILQRVYSFAFLKVVLFTSVAKLLTQQQHWVGLKFSAGSIYNYKYMRTHRLKITHAFASADTYVHPLLSNPEHHFHV